VEVISPCPTHFGRRNKLGSPIEMMKQLKEQGLNKVKYDMVPDEEKSKYFLIGKMVDRDEPDFNERYETIRNRVLEAGKDRRDD
jgi:2-oxoglutarate ferredoxin oxidoreductase subunit beta